MCLCPFAGFLTDSTASVVLLFCFLLYGALLSRFKDNIYIVFMNVLQELLPVVRRSVMCFPQCLYGVPLKWEPTELTVSWGECSWRVLPLGFSLTRKGVVWDLQSAGESAEWQRWIPAGSANARFTLASMLPSLFLKSVWYAASTGDPLFVLPPFRLRTGDHYLCVCTDLLKIYCVFVKQHAGLSLPV